MTENPAFQDKIPNNHCYGCGPNNSDGLQIKSYWEDEDQSICTFKPSPHHCAAPTKYVNGGIISTVIDCHCVCTAIAKAYQLSGRDIGEGENIWFATGKLDVSFIKPVAIDREVVLKAVVTEFSEKKITLDCRLLSEGEVCATSQVIAVRVPSSWMA